MDPERWPDQITAYVNSVTCSRCGIAKREGVMVTVRYSAPVWQIVANCLKCKFVNLLQFNDLAGVLPPKPEPQSEPEPEQVALPDWVKNL